MLVSTLYIIRHVLWKVRRNKNVDNKVLSGNRKLQTVIFANFYAFRFQFKEHDIQNW